MNILKVHEVQAGTELDGFDISYHVTVVAPGDEHDGTDIYASRFPDKAVMKAVVKTAEDPFLGYVVQVDQDVATKAGVLNLERMVNATRFEAIRGLASAEFDATAAVDMIKHDKG